VSPAARYPLSRRNAGGMAADRFPAAGQRGPQGPPGPPGPPGTIGTIQDEGAALTQRAALNFIGAGVTSADDAANGRTNVTIPGLKTVAAGANYTALAWQLVVCGAAGITITLPASPGDGDQVAIDAYQTGAGHTINGNGHQIYYRSAGQASIQIYSGASVHLAFEANFATWRVIAESTTVGGEQARAYRASAINVGPGWTLIPMETIYYDDTGRFSGGWYYPTTTPCRLFVGAAVSLPANAIIACGIAEFVGGSWIIPTRTGMQINQSAISNSVVTFAGMFRISAGDGPIGLCAYTSNAVAQPLQPVNDYRLNYLEAYRIQ
jgi:hypothetical protein